MTDKQLVRCPKCNEWVPAGGFHNCADIFQYLGKPIYDGPIDNLLTGPGAFADGLEAAYETARRVVERDRAGGIASDTIIDNVLAELAALVLPKPND